MANYVTKTMILSAPHGTRRYTTSRDIRLFEKRKSTGWTFISISLDVLRRLKDEYVLKEEYDQTGSLRSFTVQEKTMVEQ